MPQTKSQPKNWHQVKIKNLGRVVTGKTPPTKNQEYYGDKYPFITPTDISDNSIFVDRPERYLSEEGAQKVASSKLPKNSVCYTCIASVGKIAITKEDSFTNQQINSVIADPSEADYRYIFYLLRNITPQIKGMVGGAASPIINKSAFESIDIDILDLENQKKIADILFTYDNLIENNTKRIKILEEIAQAIYKEWFVYFRFPGHEKVKMVDSKTEFGKIPEGWKIEKVKDVVDLLSGYAFKSGSFVEGGKYKIITIKSVQDGQFKPEGSDAVEIAPEKMPEHCYLKDGDILLSLTGNIGRACLVYGENLLLNQRVAKLDYKKSNRPFVYGLFRNSDFQTQLQNLAIGAAQQNLSPVQTAELSMVIPAVKILDFFNELVEPMLKEIVELNKQNFVLRQARDLLLPKLVTGEIGLKI